MIQEDSTHILLKNKSICMTLLCFYHEKTVVAETGSRVVEALRIL